MSLKKAPLSGRASRPPGHPLSLNYTNVFSDLEIVCGLNVLLELQARSFPSGHIQQSMSDVRSFYLFVVIYLEDINDCESDPYINNGAACTNQINGLRFPLIAIRRLAFLSK